MSGELRILIVEDQRSLREGIGTLLGAVPGYRVAGAYASMEEALTVASTSGADVALLDIGLPGMSGIEGVRRLRELLPEVAVLMLTVHADNENVFAAICAGACGYLLKDTPPERLVAALRELHEGGAPMAPEVARKVVTMFQRRAGARAEIAALSARESEVLALLADGHSYKTAARLLSISLDTVRFHVRHIYEKLHVHSKSEAVVRALKSGLV
jgi:DNA-binding NarL/FixJ family response regulator